MDEVVEQAKTFRLSQFSGAFDVACSTCLLSQIMEYGLGILGEEHPRLIDVLSALRHGHILMLADLCKPNGLANLITDFVSSQTLPGLEGMQGEGLNRFLASAIEQRNFFHGMNPVRLLDVLTTDPEISPKLDKVRGSNTWVWNATVLHYAVTAFQFKPSPKQTSG